MARLLVLIICISMATTQRNGNVIKDRGNNVGEIQRQNRITEQIVANFLERRLFPNKPPQNRLPTIDEILPKTTTTKAPKRQASFIETTDEDDIDDGVVSDDDQNDQRSIRDSDPESLQTVESEHVDSYYDNNFDDDGSDGVKGGVRISMSYEIS